MNFFWLAFFMLVGMGDMLLLCACVILTDILGELKRQNRADEKYDKADWWKRN